MKPSKRFKRRYISFSLALDNKPPSPPEAKEIIYSHFLSFFGELGVSKLAFKIVEYEPASGKGILRCERSMADDAIFCMACLYLWKGKPCRLEPLSTSGILKKC